MKNLKEILLFNLFIMVVGLSCNPIYSVECRKYSPRSCAMLLNSSEQAGLLGAVEIGYIVAKKTNFKGLSEEVAKLGGDYYLPNYHEMSVTGNRRVLDNVTSYTTGGRNDVARTRYTTYSYRNEVTSSKAYWIYIYRKSPYYILEKCVKQCGCKKNYDNLPCADSETLKKYLEQGYKVDTVDQYGMPCIYYLIDCFTYPLADENTASEFDEDYKRLEVFINAGANLNRVPENIKITPKMKYQIPWCIKYPKGIPIRSLLKVVRDRIRSIEILLGVYIEENDTKKVNHYKKYMASLKKVESLLVKNGAKEFVGG